MSNAIKVNRKKLEDQLNRKLEKLVGIKYFWGTLSPIVTPAPKGNKTAAGLFSLENNSGKLKVHRYNERMERWVDVEVDFGDHRPDAYEADLHYMDVTKNSKEDIRQHLLGGGVAVEWDGSLHYTSWHLFCSKLAKNAFMLDFMRCDVIHSHHNLPDPDFEEKMGLVSK